MKPSIYIETSIIGYLTTRLSNLLVAAANQQLTRQWWDDHREQFDLYVSRAVVEECASGDETAAAERLELIKGMETLDITTEIGKLADALRSRVPLPEKAEIDAIHVAAAAVNSIKYSLTWNCKHIANASLRPKIESVCRELGYRPRVICTPEELLELQS